MQISVYFLFFQISTQPNQTTLNILTMDRQKTEQQNITSSLITKQQTSQSLNEDILPTSTQKRPFFQRTFGPIRKGAMRGAILTLLASAMGTGIFNLPLRISQIGLIPFIIFVFICAYYSYIGMQLISQMIRKHKIDSYSDMTEKAYGKALRRMAEFCLIIYPWGITICFQVILARFSVELLYDVLKVPLYDNQTDRQNNLMNSTGDLVRVCINIGAILVSMFFILKRQIETIKKLAYIGVISVLFNVVVVIGTSLIGFNRKDQEGKQCIYHGVFSVSSSQINWFSSLSQISVIFQGIAAIFFCYVSHQMVFPLVQDLKNPTSKRLTKIFSRTHIILLTVYACIGIFAYLLLVEYEGKFPIQPLAIASIATDIMSLGKSIMVLALFVAVSLNMFPARQVFIQTFKIDTSTNKSHIIVCFILAFFSTIVAIFFVKVNSYFGLLGGTAGVMMAGGIPAMCFYKLMELERKHYIMIGFIAVITLLAVIGAVMSVIDPV